MSHPNKKPHHWIGPPILIATLTLSGCGTLATGSADKVSPGQSRPVSAHEKELGFGRTYRLHVPSTLKSNSEPRPLVVALHGGVASARIFEKQTGLSALAEEHDFLVVYPNGIGIFGLLRHWNAQWCCAKAMKENIDDVGFIDRVIQAVSSSWPVDPEAVFVVGYSNGGMLAHQYAAARGDRLAGLATFAGPAGVREGAGRAANAVEPTAALPVLIIHGTADERLDYQGGPTGRPTLGAEDSARLWATGNGCADQPAGTKQGPIKRLRFCASGSSPVGVLLLDDWGHEWPGPQSTARLPEDAPLAGFDLATEIWSFFSESRRR